MKKLMILVLSLIMVIIPLTATAEVGGTTTPVFSDIPSDWSTEALQNAIENGLLTGFDGKIMPKDNLTRAQMATIINRAFGATEKASLEGFADVNSGDWFYDEMAKAVDMGTFKGDGNNLYPNNPITREESFVVIARALKLQPSNAVPAGLTDLGNISDWAKGEVYALINAGYISGSNGLLNPKSSITRAEFAQVMYNTISAYVSTPMEYTSAAAGNLMVNVPGVTLKDMTIDGDLIVGDGVGSGNLILDNVTVTGRMVVRGGGENSIIIKAGSKVGSIIVSRVDGAVRILTEDGAVVEAIYIHDGEDKVIIEGPIGHLEILTDVPVFLVNSNVESVTVSVPNAELTINEDSKVENLVVSEISEDSKISVEGIVATAIVEAPKATVEGNGDLKEVLVTSTSNDTSITTPRTKITTEEGATNVTGTGGLVIPEGTTANNDKDTSKPAVVEDPKGEEKPKDEDKTSSGGSALRLESATINGSTENVSRTGNSLEVRFSIEGESDIEARFNKPVKIVKVQVGEQTDEAPFEKIEFITGMKVPLKMSETLTLSIQNNEMLNYIVEYGSKVIVTVNDGSKSLPITISFPKN